MTFRKLLLFVLLIALALPVVASAQTYITPANDSLNVRSAPSLSASVLGNIPAGSAYQVFGRTGDWYAINFIGTRGYVYAPYAAVIGAPVVTAPVVVAPVVVQPIATAPQLPAPYLVAQPPPPVIESPLLNRAAAYVTPRVDMLNLRNAPGLHGGVIAQIPFSYALRVFGQTGDWYLVEFAGLHGYVFAPYTDVVRDPSIPPANPNTVIGYTDEAEVGIYRRPWQTSLQVGLFPIGVGVNIVGRSADGRWVEILYDGQQGWVDASRLRYSSSPNVLPVRP